MGLADFSLLFCRTISSLEVEAISFSSHSPPDWTVVSRGVLRRLGGGCRGVSEARLQKRLRSSCWHAGLPLAGARVRCSLFAHWLEETFMPLLGAEPRSETMEAPPTLSAKNTWAMVTGLSEGRCRCCCCRRCIKPDYKITHSAHTKFPLDIGDGF